MEKFKERIINSLPYFILIVIFGFFSIFIYKNNLSYEQLIDIIQVLIWPTIVLLALLFFKKVFTYLFFSMEEFNFFGARGELKNITEVIEERVENRIKQTEDEKNRNLEIERISEELNRTKKSKDNSEQKVTEAFKIAERLFKDYKDLSLEHAKTKKELSELKQEQILRNKARTRALRQMRIDREHRIHREDSVLQEEVDSDVAADEYINRRIEEERGK